MASPAARLATGGVGVQLIVASAGRPVTVQLASVAADGPWLLQVMVPETVLPTAAVGGMPLMAATRSAAGVMARVFVLVLFTGLGSSVVVPAVVRILNVPLLGAVNVLVQVMLSFSARVAGTGFGVHVLVAPGGRPVSVQLGAAAGLTPLLVHVPDTVTG